ncbi:MAG: YveK family protein [Gaiellaceae bacterium]
MPGDRRLVVVAGALAGLVLAAVATLLQDDVYRADASIALVRQGQPPGSDPELAQAAAAAAELLHSRAVAESAAANLRLEESADELLDRVRLSTEPESSLVRVEVEAPSRDEARRTAQELTEVATVLYNDRFGPATVASIWEAPRAGDDRVSPRPARNLALGALAGALLAQLLLLRRGRRPAPARPAPAPAPLAPAAAVPQRAAQPAPPPEPEPESEPAPTGPFVEPRLGEWNLRDVELLFAEQGPAFPDRVAELGFYLDSFRDVAGPGGSLPGGVEAVVEDVFRDLIARARATSPA